MGKGDSSLTTFRLLFWALSILPFAALVVERGPVGFAQWLQDVCTVDRSIAYSTVLKSSEGYAIVDNLYVFLGVPYIVSDAPSQLVDVNDIANGCQTPNNEAASCVPSSGSIKIISLSDAHKLFGRFYHKVPGVSFISTTNPLPSSSHIDAALASLWRAYSSLKSTSNPSKSILSLPPRKLLLPSVNKESLAASNATSTFVSVETKTKWEDWAKTTEARRFDRAVIAHRA